MKILVSLNCSILDQIGGSEVQLQLLSEFLTKNGYNVVYFVMEGKRGDPFLELYNGIKFYRNKKSKNRLRQIYNTLILLNKIIKRENPSLIYTRSLKYLFLINIVAKLKRKPILFHLPSFINKDDLSFFKSIKFFIKNKKKLFDYISIKTLKFVDLVLCVNKASQKFLKKEMKINSTTIYNMQPVPKPPFIKSNPPLVVWVSNIKKIKRPELFIELAKRCKGLNANFIMAGKSMEGLWGEDILKKINKTSNLEYIGEINLQKANELFAKASIVVLTSKSEGFSNSCIQGWLRETPLVSLVDTDDILKKYRIGFYSKNFEQMVNNIIYLIKNEDIRKEMGKKARQYAVQNHDIKKIGGKYLEIFETISVEKKSI